MLAREFKERMSESDNLIPSDTNQPSCHSRLCLQSKAAILVVLWTVFIGTVYTVVCIGFAIVVNKNQLVGSTVDSVVTYPASIVYSILAIVSMLYPLSNCLRLILHQIIKPMTLVYEP